MNKFDKHFWIPYIILLTLILIRLIPFFYPESRTWGFNHLIYLPDEYSFAFLGLAVFALILPFWKKSEKWSEGFVDKFSFGFFESSAKFINRLVFIIIITALLIVFSAPTHFLGDGYDVIYNLASKTGIHIKWSEVAITQFMIFFRSLLGDMSEEKARLAFQTVSITSGFFTLFLLFLICQIISEDKFKRYLMFFVSLISGVMLLFFGYAEYYPMLWIFFTGTIYFSLKFLETGRGLFISWFFLVCGLILHFEMVILVPAVIFATFADGRGYRIYCRFKRYLISLGTVSAIVLAILFILKYTSDLYIEDIFLPLFSGKPIDPDYAIFSVSHMTDIFNQLILLSPALFIVLFAAGKNIGNIYKEKKSIYLGLAALTALTFLFVIDPKLGMPRDWDLFSFSAFAPAILLIILMTDKSLQRIKNMIPALTVYLLISILPFLLVNLNENNSEKYCEYITHLDSNKSLSTVVVLQDYYKRKGNDGKVDSLREVYNSRYAWINQYNLAINAMDEGNMELAKTIIRSLKPNKFDADYQRVQGRYYFISGDNIRALEYLNNAIQLRQYNSLYFWQRAMIYVGLSQNDKALGDLKHAYDLDNSSLRVLDGLAYLYYSAIQYDSSIYYAKEMIRIDSSQLGAYYLLANSYYKLKYYNDAYQNARHFIDKTEGTNIYNQQRELLINMIDLIGRGSKAP